jgi:hypothetical protein
VSASPRTLGSDWLDPERVAYWYFRLNGFLQIENFVVHPPGHGGQRTDADLLAVRFPYRAERLFDAPGDIMADDKTCLDLSDQLIDVVIAEIKANQPCKLNGPWTKPEDQNVHRVLAAIGCVPHTEIHDAARDIYSTGLHASGSGLRVRLVAVGSQRSDTITAEHPAVTQVVWTELTAFIFNRLRRYRRQKTQVDQWDRTGKVLHSLASQHRELGGFSDEVRRQIGVFVSRRS